MKWLFLASVTGNFIPLFLFPLAETKVSSSIAGICNSMMPVFVIIIGFLFWNNKTNKKQIIGVVISLLGVILLLSTGNSSTKTPIFYALLLLLATILYGVSVTTVGAKLTHIPAKLMSSFVFFYVLFFPSLFALYFSNFFLDFHFTKEKMIGLGYVSMLSIIGTGFAMILQYRLMSISNPLFASSVTLIMPIVALFWGELDGEKLAPMHFLGGGLILAGLIFLRKNSSTKENRNPMKRRGLK